MQQFINNLIKYFFKTIFLNDLDTTYESLTAASKETGISSKSISHCLTGRIKTAGGYRWDYVE